MRKIKFRAWDKTASTTSTSGVMLSWEDLKKYKCENIFIPSNREVFLMQYTGLKDKNDKEIYEGDIINAGDTYYFDGRNKIGVIKHIITGAGSTLAFTINGGTYPWDYRQCKIIGNIYENPELKRG